MKNTITSILVALLLLPAVGFSAEYTIDLAHTTVGFKIKHMTIANVSGWFEDFTGSFTVDDKNSLSGVEAEIVTKSINTKIEKRDTHLRSADFFEVETYPTMKFKTISIEPKGVSGYLVKGELTIKNNTKIVELDGELNGPVKDPWGNERSAIVLTGEINRKDFGLNWNKLIETGGLLVGETVSIYLEGEGIRK
nr:YceI family protein [Desulfobulbaceae bacterium]